MLFPAFDNQPVMGINLDREAAAWQARQPDAGAPEKPNPLLDPGICGQMVAQAHQRAGVAWSYGGYLENRSRLWRGSYLEKSGNFMHLGVDFNVPQGTAIVANFSAGLVVVDNDHDPDGGWGERIILRPDGLEQDVLLIYAHLQEIRFKPGDRIPAGAVLAEVGGPPHNGNWHPHLHVQAIRRAQFEAVLVNQFQELDGYGHPSEQASLSQSFPDPLPLVAPQLVSRR